jgi:hypothetical protein
MPNISAPIEPEIGLTSNPFVAILVASPPLLADAAGRRPKI